MLPKLHLICSTDELRPAMTYVQITRKDLRATDGWSLAIIPTEKTALAQVELPETPVYLHRDSYKLLTAPSIVTIVFDPLSDQFIAYHKGNKPYTVVPLTKMDERYPDFEPLIPRWSDATPLDMICVNPKLLLNLAEAIAEPGQKNLNVALGLIAKNRCLLVKSLESGMDSTALIMPIYVGNPPF
jgi:hypothetical protein